MTFALAFGTVPAVGRRPYSADVQALLDQFATDLNAGLNGLPVVSGFAAIANALGEVGWDYAAVRSNVDVFSKSESDAQYVQLSSIDIDSALTANSDTRVPSQKAIKSYVDAATVGVNPFDTSGAVPLMRQAPATRMGLPLRTFRLALGDRQNTPVTECVIGDSLAQLWATDAENNIWPALYERAMAATLNTLPRESGLGFLSVDSPAGFPFPRLIHWDTVQGIQTSVIQTGVATDVTANTFGLTAHGYANGTPMSFTGLTNTLGVANNVVTYVVNTAANTWQVAATPGGSPIDLTGSADAGVTAVSIGGLWGRALAPTQFCEVTRTGDGVTVFLSDLKANGATATVAINGSTVGTINTTDAGIATSPGYDSYRPTSFANPAGYGPMTVRVTNTSGSGTVLLDACYITAGNLTSEYQMHLLAHGGWGMTELLDPQHPTQLQYIKNNLPQLVTIHLGANDYRFHAITSTQFGTLITNSVAAIRAQYGANPLPSIRFIMEPTIDPGTITPTTWDTTYRAVARAVCEADGNLGFIDWFEALGTYGAGAGNDVYDIAPNDEVHPGDKAHVVLADAVYDATSAGGAGGGSTGSTALLDPWIALTRSTFGLQPALRIGDGTGLYTDLTHYAYLTRANDGHSWILTGTALNASVLRAAPAAKTGNYTLVLGDGGKALHYNSASAGAFTVPPNSSVAFPLGTMIEFFDDSTGDLTITPGAGVTIDTSIYQSLVVAAPNGSTTIRKYGTDLWKVVASTDMGTLSAGILAFATTYTDGTAARLTRTAVKTGAYTAVPGDLVVVSTAGGSVTITLPTAASAGPKARIGILHETQGGTNTVTFGPSGGDTFSPPASAAFGVMIFEGTTILESDGTSIWTIVGDHTSTSELDSRYPVLLPVGVVTASSFTAAKNTLVPLDTTSNVISVTLPTAPADGSTIVLKVVAPSPMVNAATFTCGGSDVINRAGVTSGSLSVVGQSVWLRYTTTGAVWYAVVTDTPLAQLDLRFAPITGIPEASVTNLVSDLALKAPLDSAALTTLFSLSDATASHGKVLGSVGVVGAGINFYGNSGDSVGKMVLNTTTLAFGPGGSTATDVNVHRTGTATGAMVGTWTIPAPVISGHATIEGVTPTGATGTGKLVFDGTPTLVTPVIGAATGTSLVLSGALTAATLTTSAGGVSASLFSDIADVASPANTSENDLFTHTLTAGQLAANGDAIEWTVSGTFASNVRTKDLRFYFGGTDVFDTGVLAFTGAGGWTAKMTVIRESTTVVRASVLIDIEGSSTVVATAPYARVTGLTLSATQIIKVTGQVGAGAAASDIIAKMSKCIYQPT